MSSRTTVVTESMLRRWRMTPRWLRFLFVGGLNTVFGYGAYAALLFSGLHYTSAALIGTIAGVAFNYFTTGGLVFEHLSQAALVRFVLVYVLVYALNIGGIALLERARINAYVGGLVLILPMAALSYVLLGRLVFGGRRVAD